MTQTQKVRAIMLEALRRYHSFHKDKTPFQAWTGLGTPGEYKEVVKLGYMEPVHDEIPRMAGWYRLTTKGLMFCLQLHNEGFVVRDCQIVKMNEKGRA